MDVRRLLAGGALVLVVVALGAAVVLQDASLALWTAIGVGVVALVAGAAVLYAGARRAYLLARYIATRPVGVDDAADAAGGTGWLRVRGEVAAPSDVTAVLSGEQVAGRRLRLERRTHPSDVAWPGIDRRELGAETDLGTLALVGERDRVRFAGDGTTTLAAPSTREQFDADDDPGYELIDALQHHDRHFDAVVGDGLLGTHRLHVFESTVGVGDAVELFGLLTVADDGGVPTLSPAEGRGGTVALGRGRRLPLLYLRGALAGLAGGALLLYIGWSVLGLAAV